MSEAVGFTSWHGVKRPFTARLPDDLVAMIQRAAAGAWPDAERVDAASGRGGVA